MKILIGIVVAAALSVVSWIAGFAWTGNKLAETSTASYAVLSKQMNAEHAAAVYQIERRLEKLEKQLENNYALAQSMDKKLTFICDLAAECRTAVQDK